MSFISSHYIPPEIISHIISFLPNYQRQICRLVCVSWSNSIRNDPVSLNESILNAARDKNDKLIEYFQFLGDCDEDLKCSPEIIIRDMCLINVPINYIDSTNITKYTHLLGILIGIGPNKSRDFISKLTSKGYKEVLNNLFINKPEYLEHKNNGMKIAAEYGYKELVLFYKNLGADNYEESMIEAIKGRNTYLAKLFIKWGAENIEDGFRVAATVGVETLFYYFKSLGAVNYESAMESACCYYGRNRKLVMKLREWGATNYNKYLNYVTRFSEHKDIIPLLVEWGAEDFYKPIKNLIRDDDIISIRLLYSLKPNYFKNLDNEKIKKFMIISLKDKDLFLFFNQFLKEDKDVIYEDLLKQGYYYSYLKISPEVIKCLVNFSKEVDLVGYLYESVKNGNVEIVKYLFFLLKKEYEKDIKRENKSDDIERKCRKRLKASLTNSFLKAIERNNYTIVSFLLENGVTKLNKGLMTSVNEGNLVLIKLFVRFGASNISEAIKKAKHLKYDAIVDFLRKYRDCYRENSKLIYEKYEEEIKKEI